MSAEKPAASADQGIALRMAGICKRFGPVQALDRVGFSVRRGTVHALVGENGAGKSTLMKILAGVYQPDAGTIEIDGKPRAFKQPSEALAAGVPVVMADTEVAREVCGEAALFVDPGDRAGVAGCMESLLFDPDVRQRQLAAAAELLPLYSWNRTASATLAALESAAGLDPAG